MHPDPFERLGAVIMPAADSAGGDLDDIIEFLTNRRPEVKMAALGIVLGLSGSPEGLDRLKTRLSEFLPVLLRIVTEPAQRASEQALSCLVNITAEPSAVPLMLRLGAVGRTMDYLREGTVSSVKLLVMLLTNLTSLDKGCEELLQLGQGKLEGLHMAVLLKKFVTSGVMLESGQEDAYEHVAAILTNVTRIRQGRELLLQPGRGLLQALASQLKSTSEMRKRGVAGAIRNCCMTAEEDGTLPSIVSDERVLSFLLQPINGKPPKEKDDTVRECLADSILSLASTEAGRKALWDVGAPELLRSGYEYEENRGVCLAMEHAAERFLTAGRIEDAPEGDRTSGAEPIAACTDAAATRAPTALNASAASEQLDHLPCTASSHNCVAAKASTRQH